MKKTGRLRWGLLALGLVHCGGDGSRPTSLPAARRAVSPVTEPPVTEPPDPCDALSLEIGFLGADQTAGTARGALALAAPDPATALDFVRPYAILVPDGGANLDPPGLRPTVGVFVSDLRFEREGDGFRQAMTVEWIGALEVRATAPGCDPVSVSCDDRRCAAAAPGS